MSRSNTALGADARENLINLLEALVSLAREQDDVEDSACLSVKAEWTELNSVGKGQLKVTGRREEAKGNRKKIISGTTLLDLAELIEKSGKELNYGKKSKPFPKNNDSKKEIIQSVIDNLRKLDLFRDLRPTNEKGKPVTSSGWKFTLNLNQDIEKNKESILANWDKKVRNSQSSKAIANTTISSKAQSSLDRATDRGKSSDLSETQSLITTKRNASKKIEVFIAHSDNCEDKELVKKIRFSIEKYRIKCWQESQEGKRESSKKDARVKKIRECDFFMVIVSKYLLDHESELDCVSEQLGLAYSLYQEREKPKILFLLKDIEDRLNIEIPVKDMENFKIRDWDNLRVGENEINKTETFYSLLEILLPPITFIDNLNNSKDFNWFKASQKPYKEEFFTNENERMSFSEISWRIDKYNSNLASEWYELYALWHLDKDMDRIESDQLSESILAMGYISVHLDSGYCFYNYLALKAFYNIDSCREFFSKKLENQIINLFRERRNSQRLKAVFLETYPIDIKFLVSIAESDTTNISTSEERSKILEQFRYLGRIKYFFESFIGKNAYIILNNIKNNPETKNFLGDPLPYWQPGMEEPVEEKNTEFFLILFLFDLELFENQNLQIEGFIHFVLEKVFLSGSDKSTECRENVIKVRDKILEECRKSECRLGKIHNINTNNKSYDMESLFNKLEYKIKAEDMENRTYKKKTLKSELQF